MIPLVTHGVSAISRLQVWTQPLWLLMLVVPFVYVLVRDPGAFSGVLHYGGELARVPRSNCPCLVQRSPWALRSLPRWGAGRLPALHARPHRHHARPLVAGRAGGQAGLGGAGRVLKMLGGALLAWLALTHMVPAERAVDPNQMYLVAYEYVFPHYGWAVAATALFVVVSQIKINVTNAYAGSLAWSNFSRASRTATRARGVGGVPNTLIAFMLMEMNVFRAMGEVLGLYSNIAIAWIMSVVADPSSTSRWAVAQGHRVQSARTCTTSTRWAWGRWRWRPVLSISAHLGLFGCRRRRSRP